MSRITTWCAVSAIRRPSIILAASVELPHVMGCSTGGEGGGEAVLAWSHDASESELPRSYVEMIMNANSPAFGEHIGRAEAVPGGGLAQGMSVMSKVRSRPGGLVLAWGRSLYFQDAG